MRRCGDREGVHGRREEPVEEHEPADGRDRRGPGPADRGDRDHEQQVTEGVLEAEVARADRASANVSSGRPTMDETRRRRAAAGQRREPQPTWAAEVVGLGAVSFRSR